MEPQRIRQLHGAAQLITEAVDAAIGGIEEAQQSITRKVYAPLTLIGPIAPPARAIEQVQEGITTNVYQLVRTINRVLGATAAIILEQLGSRVQPVEAEGDRIPS